MVDTIGAACRETDDDLEETDLSQNFNGPTNRAETPAFFGLLPSSTWIE